MDVMEFFTHWAGFLGAWLLVAGPLLQAAIELRDEELDREGFERVRDDVEPLRRISRWWWLLPPVAFYKTSKRNSEYRRKTMLVLSPEQRAQLLGFQNKATGWFTVAGGAFLIALKETGELLHLYELPDWLYWIVVVVLAILCVTNTVARLSRSDDLVHADDPGWHERQRAIRDAELAKRRTPRRQRTRTDDSADQP